MARQLPRHGRELGLRPGRIRLVEPRRELLEVQAARDAVLPEQRDRTLTLRVGDSHGREIVHSHVIASEQPCRTTGFAPNLGQNE